MNPAQYKFMLSTYSYLIELPYIIAVTRRVGYSSPCNGWLASK